MKNSVREWVRDRNNNEVGSRWIKGFIVLFFFVYLGLVLCLFFILVSRNRGLIIFFFICNLK